MPNESIPTTSKTQSQKKRAKRKNKVNQLAEQVEQLTAIMAKGRTTEPPMNRYDSIRQGRDPIAPRRLNLTLTVVVSPPSDPIGPPPARGSDGAGAIINSSATADPIGTPPARGSNGAGGNKRSPFIPVYDEEQPRLKKPWWQSTINLRFLQETNRIHNEKRGWEVLSFVNQYQIGVDEHTKALEKEMTLKVQELEKEMSLKVKEHERAMALKVEEHIEAMAIKDKELETLKKGLATALELSNQSKKIIDSLAEISPAITNHLRSLL